MQQERTYIYTGDAHGMIKCWDITMVLEKSGFGPVPSFIETAINFYPNRI